MKVTCNREKLWSAFQTVSMVVPTRSPKPILQNVKFVSTSEENILMATDMEVGIRMIVEGIEVEAPGSVVLPVGRFGSILRESTDETLVIEADERQIVIKGERSKFTLQAADPVEFPSVAAFDSEAFHEIPVALMRELIHRTLFATDVESSRYALGGVLLEMDADKIVAVATDGRRLAKMEGPAKTIGEPNLGEAMIIVPSKSMQLIERAITDSDAEIQIAAAGNEIRVRGSHATIFTRLVEGRFPKWRDVLPRRQGTNEMQLTVGPLYAGLRQASIVATEESRGVEFTFGDGSLVMAGSTAEVGQSRIEIPIAYDDSPISISLDHRFVADFLKVLPLENNVLMEIKTGDEPAVLRTEDGYEYVIMPLSQQR